MPRKSHPTFSCCTSISLCWAIVFHHQSQTHGERDFRFSSSPSPSLRVGSPCFDPTHNFLPRQLPLSLLQLLILLGTAVTRNNQGKQTLTFYSISLLTPLRSIFLNCARALLRLFARRAQLRRNKNSNPVNTQFWGLKPQTAHHYRSQRCRPMDSTRSPGTISVPSHRP